jgi:hypothetical protein
MEKQSHSLKEGIINIFIIDKCIIKVQRGNQAIEFIMFIIQRLVPQIKRLLTNSR